VRGAELGLRTAVLEAGTDESYLCSCAGRAAPDPNRAKPLHFPFALLSGNDFSGYFGRSFWPAPSG
jgi:hypothetical protein